MVHLLFRVQSLSVGNIIHNNFKDTGFRDILSKNLSPSEESNDFQTKTSTEWNY